MIGDGDILFGFLLTFGLGSLAFALIGGLIS